jgi:hypothetical protein
MQCCDFILKVIKLTLYKSVNMKKIMPFMVIFICLRQEVAGQLSAVINTTQPTCTQPTGSATVVATGGSNYAYKWSTGATTATVSGLAPGTYAVTVYSVSPVFNIVYSQNFEGMHGWTLNIPTGFNGADNNYWIVNDTEGGMPAGSCRAQYNGDKTLHITSACCPTWGAKYDAGGLCGVLYCPETNMAAQSPDISTMGVTALQLLFDFMANGSGLTDNASLYYSVDGGNNFTLLDASLKTTNCSGSNGRWGSRKYNLPAAANNISNFKIRFNWTNNDDGIGTDPSIAINNIVLRDSIFAGDSVVVSATINQPSQPVINTDNITITLPSCGQSNGSITGIAVSGGTAPYQVQWTQNGIVYSNSFPLLGAAAGIYTFEVTDAAGCTTDTSFTLTSQGAQSFTLTVSNDSICEGESAILCAPSSGAVSYLWNTGATTSCISVFAEGDYAAIVTYQNGCTGISDTATITTLPLPAPMILSKGDSLFASGGISYQWYVNGNPISGATESKYTATESGDYYVLITAENGCSIFSDTITVTLSSLPHSVHHHNILCYPLPFNEELVVQFPTKEPKFILILDLNGKLLFMQMVSDDIISLKTAILPPGTYLLTVQEKENKKSLLITKF